jgi:hypothetical protein
MSTILLKAEGTLKTIDYTIKTLDYLVNEPMGDYVHHTHAVELVVDRLNELQRHYRKITGEYDFNWHDRRIIRKG